MIEKAKKTDRLSVIEFIDKVFNEDFSTLHPKLYSKNNSKSIENHYIIKNNERIQACLCMEKIDLMVKGKTLQAGVIGSVSVHESARGKGYMKMLVEKAICDAKNSNYDLLALYGDKHRYRNFGFEPMGIAANAKFISANKKFAKQKFEFVKAQDSDLDFMYEIYNKKSIKIFRDKQRFFDILNTWRSDIFLVLSQGEKFGYLVYDRKHNLIEEVVAMNKNSIVDIILNFDFESITYELFYDDFDLLNDLQKYCESISFTHCCNINILNSNRVFEIFENRNFYGVDFCDLFVPRIDNI